MKQLSCSFILALLAIFVQQHECSKLEPQIKMIRPQLWHVNREYTRAVWYNIQKHNETYNDIGAHWEVIKDLPIDVFVRSKVYLTDSNYRNDRLVLDETIKVCFESDKRHLLPKIEIVPESALGTQCMKKGIYDMKDMGQFRFEVLLPNIEKMSKYYRADYTVGNRKVDILVASFYSEWGYLHKN